MSYSQQKQSRYIHLSSRSTFPNLEHSFFSCGSPTHMVMESWKIVTGKGFWIHNDQKLILKQAYYASEVFQALNIHVSSHNLTAALVLNL